MIERKITVPIELAPEELAFEFCNMGSGEQANFFNEVAAISANWTSPFCFQLEFIAQNDLLTDEGRSVMEQIGAYGQDSTKQAAPALLDALISIFDEHVLLLNSTGKDYNKNESIIKAHAAIAAARGDL